MNFNITSLNDKTKSSLIDLGIWSESCPVPLDRLCLANISHLDFAGNIKDGNIICLDIVAENVMSIFKELLEAKFPIEKADCFLGKGEPTSNINITSCFYNRLIAGTTKISIHSYGLAIDINPNQNPVIYFEESEAEYAHARIYPKEGKSYINRMLLKPGMVEPITNIFFKNGLDIWGGLWHEPIDYHHFEVNRSLSEKLTSLPKEDAAKEWYFHLQNCKKKLE